MASHSHQYIFGEFSPDEFSQFFLTPQCYVELPPFSEKVSCVSQSSGDGCDHIRFGVDELMDPEPGGAVDAACKLSSNLNPRAPEFILGCQPPQMADGSDFDSVDDPEPRLPPLDGSASLGGLAQRERKKKKKRPPGYYSYMEGQGCGPAAHTKSPLVNGHAPATHVLESEDLLREGGSGAELSGCGDGASVMVTSGDANSRTCESPGVSPLELSGRAASLPDPSTVGHPSLSVSHEGAGEVRTAEQQPEPPDLQSPELLDNGRQSLHLPLPSLAAAPTSALTTETERRLSQVSEQAAPSCSTPVEGQTADSKSPDGESRPGAQPAELSAPAASPAPPAGTLVSSLPKSWASLFHNSKPLSGGLQVYVQVKSGPPGEPAGPASAVTPEQSTEGDQGSLHVSEDPLARRLAELIENVKLMHKPVSLQPRGLINKGNWCYINATLQALVACPPMYHLMKSLPVVNRTQSCSSTPMINNFVRLVNEFSNMPVPSRAKLQATGDKVTKDVRPGVPFEPSYMYRLLTVIKSSLSEKGRQEDAEEYLGYILNGLHEEMLALKKLLCPQEEKGSTLNGPDPHLGGEEDTEGRADESDDEWEQVGPRNKASVTRQADFVRTPITDIFGGHIRSVVYQQSSKESATLQPFFTLQLDIQSEKVRTVQEALENLVARESLQGYTSKTKQEIEVSRRVTLEELPPVLVLHLKRFVFEKNGGCQKLVKNIDYPIDLEISKDLLSPGVRSKIFKGQRSYRLFAVVYHHGNSATGGHYTTDVFHIGLSGWLRIDDQVVKVISQHQVLKQTADRTAYLLYYRRLDLV